MNQLIKLIPFLLLMGIYAPSYASVNDVELITCAVFSDSEEEGDKKPEGDKKGEEEEEPDCE